MLAQAGRLRLRADGALRAGAARLRAGVLSSALGRCDNSLRTSRPRRAAYEGDLLVAEGTAAVDVVAGQQAGVLVNVLDVTTPPALDHGPLIWSLTASNVAPGPGESVTLTVNAVDPDGDPLSYAWTQSCGSGVFTAPDAASTGWASAVDVGCALTVTVTANGLSASASVTVLVSGSAIAGTVSVTTDFLVRPWIESIELDPLRLPGAFDYTIARSEDWCDGMPGCTANASIQYTYFPGEKQALLIGYHADFTRGGDALMWLDDDCGGSAGDVKTYAGSAYVEWTAPSVRALCMITTHASQHGMSDAFTLAALVDGCVDDRFEPNDTVEVAAYAMGTYPYLPEVTGLFANNADWFYVYPKYLSAQITFTAASPDAIPMEVYASDMRTLVASGMNQVQATFPPTNDPLYIKVGPGASAATCGSPYDLTFAQHQQP